MSMMNKTSYQYDVIIVGGGMVGASLAVMLGQNGLRVVLLDKSTEVPNWSEDKVDIRVSAITRASENILRHLGVWQDIVNKRVAPYREMFVWDSSGNGSIHFDSAELAQPSLGHIVENSVIQSSLWQRLAHLDTVELVHPVQIEKLTVHDHAVEVDLGDGQVLTAPLVVGADGSNSWVREQFGIKSSERSYGQSAVVAHVRTELANGKTAWQRFLPGGPLAFLPMGENSSSIVWSCSTEQAEELVSLPELEFNQAITRAFAARLGDVSLLGPRGAFPLRMKHAREYVRPRLALVGDAAHTIHPLAGQGANLGFADAASLAEVLISAKAQDRDIGARWVLRKYERWRKGQNLATGYVMDGFKHLFSNRIPPLVLLRNLGLSGADKLPGFKLLAGEYALGLKGDMPKMAMAAWDQETSRD